MKNLQGNEQQLARSGGRGAECSLSQLQNNNVAREGDDVTQRRVVGRVGGGGGRTPSQTPTPRRLLNWVSQTTTLSVVPPVFALSFTLRHFSPLQILFNLTSSILLQWFTFCVLFLSLPSQLQISFAYLSTDFK